MLIMVIMVILKIMVIVMIVMIMVIMVSMVIVMILVIMVIVMIVIFGGDEAEDDDHGLALHLPHLEHIHLPQGQFTQKIHCKKHCTSASRSNLEYKLQDKHIFEAWHILEHLHLTQGQVQINFTFT